MRYLTKRYIFVLSIFLLICFLVGCSSNAIKNDLVDDELNSDKETVSEGTANTPTQTLYRTAHDFHEGVAWVSYSNKSSDTLIDTNGNILFQLTGEYPLTDFYNGVALTSKRLIDKKNNTIFEASDSDSEEIVYRIVNNLETADDPFYGYTFVKIDTNTFDTVKTEVGILDSSGNWYHDPCVELCNLLDGDDIVKSCGYGIYKNERNSFYYNLLTDTISSTPNSLEQWKRDYLLKCSEGLAFSEGEKRSGWNDYFADAGAFYNSEGKKVIDLSSYHIFTNISGNGSYAPIFSEGYCVLEIGGADYALERHTQYIIVIDSSGEKVFSPMKIGTRACLDEKRITISNGFIVTPLGYLNVQGELVIPKENLPYSGELNNFSEDGLARISSDGGDYFINTTGEIAF